MLFAIQEPLENFPRRLPDSQGAHRTETSHKESHWCAGSSYGRKPIRMAELYSTLGGALAPRPHCRRYRTLSRSWNREHSLGSRSAAGRSWKDSPCIQVSLTPRRSSEDICFGHTNCEVFVRLRDVNLFAAMALPEDQATEVIIHLRPHLIATSGSTPASWWEYTVSSCVGTDQLRDNSRGLVTIDYEENRSEQMATEDTRIEATQIADYHDILKDCPEIYSKEKFYQHMTKASWSYGELFQGVENCHPGYGKTAFDIRLVDIGETFSKGQFDRPFLINAASLDAVFQSWLGATYNNGAFEFDKPFVPTSIGELEISVNIPADADYVMPGLCRAERYGFNELSADIVCFDTELSKVFLSVKDFRTSELEMDAGKPDGESVEVDPADITSEVQWNFALGLLQPEEISQVVSVVAAQDRLTEVSSESFSLPRVSPRPLSFNSSHRYVQYARKT